VICTVIARQAMLKSVRWGGFGTFIRKVHCVNALATLTSIVACGPSKMSDVKSIA
jgi:hypothetical protein